VVKDVNVQSTDSIMMQTDSLITPVNYLGTIDFRQMDPELRKQKFINYLLPSIVIVRERLLDNLHHVEFIEEKMSQNKKIYLLDSLFLDSMKMKYKTDSMQELKKRIYPHPVSLALTQAVLESGWGTSSIARKGHNFYGILSLSPDETRLKMQFNDSEDDIYLRTYDSVIESVENYYLLISRVSSYKKFRDRRWEGTPSSRLLYFLDSYHETEQYAELANSIIHNNDLARYDIASINPAYMKKISLYAYLKSIFKEKLII
jgi:Bax protein